MHKKQRIICSKSILAQQHNNIYMAHKANDDADTHF